jgi:hypothetical protein
VRGPRLQDHGRCDEYDRAEYAAPGFATDLPPRMRRSDCDLERLVGGVVQFETEFGDRDRYDREADLDPADV